MALTTSKASAAVALATSSSVSRAVPLPSTKHLPGREDQDAREEFAAACAEAARDNATTFNFSYNPAIVRVPDELNRLKATLQILHIDNCFNLEVLPSTIGELRQLRWLNVQYNKLKSLPPAIGKLVRLERLHCGNNELTSLPLEIAALSELEELQCDNNKLRTLVSPVLQLPKLRLLHVENNPFITKTDVSGLDAYTVLPPPEESGAVVCSLTRLRMRDIRPVTFVSFHSFLGLTNLPLVHYVVDQTCKEQLKRRLVEMFGNKVEFVADPPTD
jgi:Leucine-rich repeat (LRR) protein